MGDLNKYYLFLDDVRFPKDVKWIDLPSIEPYSWTIVRNYNEFCDIIFLKGLPEFVTFDHDLSDSAYLEYNKTINNKINYSNITEKTGYDCAKWLVEYCRINNIKFPNYLVHSLNPIGTENIYRYVENYKRVVENFSDFNGQ
jgi:hypothetical protein